MKRRNFLGVGGSAVFGSTIFTSISTQSVIGLSIKFSSEIPNKDPSNLNSVLIRFERLDITPKYLNTDDGLDIKLSVDLGDVQTSRTVKDIGFDNNSTLNLSEIENESGSNLEYLTLDGLNLDGSFVTGTVSVTVSHSDITEKTYTRNFTINAPDKNIIDNFEDGNLTGWNNTSGATNTNVTSFDGTRCMRVSNSTGDNHPYSNPSDGLGYYPSPGESWILYVRTSNDDNRFGWGPNSVDQNSHNTEGLEMTLRPGNGRWALDVDGGERATGQSPPTDTWLIAEITWKSNYNVVARLYNPNGSYDVTLSMSQSKYTSQGGVFVSSRDIGDGGTIYVDCPTS